MHSRAWLLGALLIWTGALKVGHPEALACGDCRLPAAAARGRGAPLAVILPYFEMLLGLYLVAGLFTRIAGWVATAQFLIYAAAIASAVLRGIPANCGCFGPGDAAVADWPHVAFDLALAAIALFIAPGAPGAFALDRRLRSR